MCRASSDLASEVPFPCISGIMEGKLNGVGVLMLPLTSVWNLSEVLQSGTLVLYQNNYQRGVSSVLISTEGQGFGTEKYLELELASSQVMFTTECL